MDFSELVDRLPRQRRSADPTALAHAASLIRLGTPHFATAVGENFVNVQIEGGGLRAISIEDFERLRASADPGACARFEARQRALEARRDSEYRRLRSDAKAAVACLNIVTPAPPLAARSRESRPGATRRRGSRRNTASRADPDPGEAEPPRGRHPGDGRALTREEAAAYRAIVRAFNAVEVDPATGEPITEAIVIELRSGEGQSR